MSNYQTNPKTIGKSMSFNWKIAFLSRNKALPKINLPERIQLKQLLWWQKQLIRIWTCLVDLSADLCHQSAFAYLESSAWHLNKPNLSRPQKPQPQNREWAGKQGKVVWLEQQKLLIQLTAKFPKGSPKRAWACLSSALVLSSAFGLDRLIFFGCSNSCLAGDSTSTSL